VYELHYQTKARADGLHKNFGCYNFAYRKDNKAPVIGYRTKWPTGWINEWFYMKADEKKREKLMTMIMSPLRLSFGMTRPLCNMHLASHARWPKSNSEWWLLKLALGIWCRNTWRIKLFQLLVARGYRRRRKGERNMSLFDSPSASNLRSNSRNHVLNG
jgi:hypothetical protein